MNLTHFIFTVYIFLHSGFPESFSNASAEITPSSETSNSNTKVYVFLSKSENGVTYEYSNENGQETLRLLGDIPSDFNHDLILQEFRKSSTREFNSLPISNGAPLSSNILPELEESEIPSDSPQSKSLLEALSDFLTGTQFQQVYETLQQNEAQEHIEQAKKELDAVVDDLSKIQTQELILRSRQAELGSFLEEMLKKETGRNPTVEELVNIEDDRLALLEHRLTRLRSKLVKQKQQLENYIAIHSRSLLKNRKMSERGNGEESDSASAA